MLSPTLLILHYSYLLINGIVLVNGTTVDVEEAHGGVFHSYENSVRVNELPSLSIQSFGLGFSLA